MSGAVIESRSNPQVRELIRLQKKAGERRKSALVPAEGERLVKEIPEGLLERVYVSRTWRQMHEDQELWRRVCKEATVLSDEIFAAVTDTRTPQGIMGLVRMPAWSEADLAPAEGHALLLGLEKLQDPGNMGTILRTAEAAGVHGLIVSGDCVDLYSPKVIRSAMGAAFRMPVVAVDDFPAFLIKMRRRGYLVCAAALDGSIPYTKSDYRKDTIIVIGNEGNGLSQAALQAADQRIRIPMEPQVESLNAAVAASILMFEARRQRGR